MLVQEKKRKSNKKKGEPDKCEMKEKSGKFQNIGYTHLKGRLLFFFTLNEKMSPFHRTTTLEIDSLHTNNSFLCKENGRSNNYVAELIVFGLVSHYTNTHTHKWHVHLVRSSFFNDPKWKKKFQTESSYTKIRQTRRNFPNVLCFCMLQPISDNIKYWRSKKEKKTHDNTSSFLSRSGKTHQFYLLLMQSDKNNERKRNEWMKWQRIVILNRLYIWKKKNKWSYRRHLIVYGMTYWLLNWIHCVSVCRCMWRYVCLYGDMEDRGKRNSRRFCQMKWVVNDFMEKDAIIPFCFLWHSSSQFT